MPNHLKSANQIFSHRGLQGMDKSLIAKLYFSSNSADSFKSLQSRIEAAGYGEPIGNFTGRSFGNICDPAKTMKYGKSTAGLLTRSSCTAHSQFTPKPLDGITINNEARTLFKNKSEAGNLETDNGNFTGSTTSRAEYPNYNSDQVLGARPADFKPPAQSHMSGGVNYVKESMSHSQMTNFDPNIVRCLKSESFRPKYVHRSNKHEVVAKSVYKTDFHDEEAEKLLIPDLYSGRKNQLQCLDISNSNVSMGDMV